MTPYFDTCVVVPLTEIENTRNADLGEGVMICPF